MKKWSSNMSSISTGFSIKVMLAVAVLNGFQLLAAASSLAAQPVTQAGEVTLSLAPPASESMPVDETAPPEMASPAAPLPVEEGAAATVPPPPAGAAAALPLPEAPASPASPAEPMVAGGPVFVPDEYPSIFFTYWEHVAIRDARNSIGMVRPPTEEEVNSDINAPDQQEERVTPPPEEREIRLGGIVYRGGKDWTIWLNGKRVSPDALPKEVLDLKVYKTYVEMKWFDEYTNQIFPLRIRPHQRFNIDTRIFLPG